MEFIYKVVIRVLSVVLTLQLTFLSFAFSRSVAELDEIYAQLAQRAGITSKDSYTERAAKFLPVMNNWLHRYDPNTPRPLDKVDEPRVKALYKRYNVPFNNSGRPTLDFTPYNLDSKRTAREMLTEQIGGSCGTHGLSMLEVLKMSGVKPEDMRLIGAVDQCAYRTLCPSKGADRLRPEDDSRTKRTQPAANCPRESVSASGHVFISYKENGKWWMFDSAASCRPSPSGDSTDCFQKIEVPDPDRTSQEMSDGKPWIIPNQFRSLQSIPEPGVKRALTEMVAFRVWKYGEYPVHSFLERYDMVASGETGNTKCRFDPNDVAKASSSAYTKSPSATHNPVE